MLLENTPVGIPGIVLQELLSGVRTETQFTRLQKLLEPFPILTAERADHVLAARISNACRGRGVSTSSVDCLIAALAASRDAFLFTLDEDFARIAPLCGLKLFKSEARIG
jgi:predicted nucleic acid-binding protein